MMNIPEKELETLDFWKKNEIFQKTLRKESPSGDYVFYDGPPFATGLPHYGHIVASLMKDVIPRYWTMKGFRVARRWGWDCHGLPVENIAEEELGYSDKKDIERAGIAKFNEYCRSLVMRYANEWRAIVERIGRWVDMDNDYKTMNPDYMETIWWIFKTLWDKKLIYKGHKSMHLCPRCGTTLSNFEVTQNYKDIKDISVTVKFELVDEPGTCILAWTTTPWTLIGNVALAVGPSIQYVKVKPRSASSDTHYILAENRVSKVLGENYEVVARLSAEDLIGKLYAPLFKYYQHSELENLERGWKIYEADFVTIEEGTGVVHIAPAFGEEDMLLGREQQLPFIQHIDAEGRFTPEVTEWAGESVKPADDVGATDRKIVAYLQEKKLLLSSAEYLHSYPHCWRCETPLLNYAAQSWFVEVTKIKDDMIRNNQQIHWIPSHLRDGRFGKWLQAARDWAISRSRYWGTPLPVWVCDKCDEKVVIGSRQELKDASGTLPGDLHKHFIDAITFPCAKCTGTMKRIPEVFDCWFESGAMPYAEEHYPFDNKEKFERNFPAHFIAEGVDQTRGWFYTLLVLSTALFNKEVAKNILVNGIVLAEGGSKMSKSKKNFPDPLEVINKYGADALRFYLCDSVVMQAESLNFSEHEVRESYNRIINTLVNVLNFCLLYCDTKASYASVPRKNILDRWIVSKLHQLIQTVTNEMDKYHLVKAVRPIEDFIQELSTWYVRRSRSRFKNSETKDGAVATLRYVLLELSRVLAPFTPFVAELIWQNLKNTEDEESVHLALWSRAREDLIDGKLTEQMDACRAVVEKVHAVRSAVGIKVRQPLSKLEVTTSFSKELLAVIADEVNVSDVAVVTAVASGDAIVSDETKTVALYVGMTEKLRADGALREIVRTTNALRKKAGLKPSDMLPAVHYTTQSSFIDQHVIQANHDQLARLSVSKEWISKDAITQNFHETITIEGEKLEIGF